jgi:hypothetical protein
VGLEIIINITPILGYHIIYGIVFLQIYIFLIRIYAYMYDPRTCFIFCTIVLHLLIRDPTIFPSLTLGSLTENHSSQKSSALTLFFYWRPWACTLKQWTRLQSIFLHPYCSATARITISELEFWFWRKIMEALKEDILTPRVSYLQKKIDKNEKVLRWLGVVRSR